MKPLIGSGRPQIHLILLILLAGSLFLSACEGSLVETSPANVKTTATQQAETPASAIEMAPSSTPANEKTVVVQTMPTERLPEDWKEWPVIPQGVSDFVREVYERGMANGNNPHAFSILGDCHSLPEIFLGIYDQDPQAVLQLDENLQQTVQQFQGSFDRYSPTVVVGTTEGALLWAQWNENKEGYCLPNELPIDCELRYHKPVIAFIRVGTHWEARNEDYLRTIIDKLIENGTVPVIVTKADNRELDERVNQNLAKLAVEYQLPVWNFWASVQDLPNKGLSDESDMYLSDEAYAVQRRDGLKTLDIIYRALEE